MSAFAKHIRISSTRKFGHGRPGTHRHPDAQRLLRGFRLPRARRRPKDPPAPPWTFIGHQDANTNPLPYRHGGTNDGYGCICGSFWRARLRVHAPLQICPSPKALGGHDRVIPARHDGHNGGRPRSYVGGPNHTDLGGYLIYLGGRLYHGDRTCGGRPICTVMKCIT